MRQQAETPIELKSACLDEAYRIIEEDGLQKLSIRDVARRLGVSHQAPYKHFPSRDHILAALVARIFDEFAAYLDDRPAAHDANADLFNMGMAYLDYAAENPLKYRLMFNTPLPPPDEHPDMMKNARSAFALLHGRLKNMPVRMVSAEPRPQFDAMFIWSALHGFASILQSDVMAALEMPGDTNVHGRAHLFARLAAAMEPE